MNTQNTTGLRPSPGTATLAHLHASGRPLAFLILLLFLGPSATAATFTISMINVRFNPPNLTINVGDTVTWRCDVGFHDTVSGVNGVPSGVWDSNTQFRRLMRPGEQFSFTFNSPGTYPYYCTPHWPLGMVGTITVLGVNSAPSVSIISPPDGANLSAPADITLEATASDPDGDPLTVEFFMNQNPLGSFSAPPYRIVVPQLGPGNYTFSAIASDGTATASASVSVTVSNTPTGTAASLTLHPASQTVQAGTNVSFTAAAIGSSPLFWRWFFNDSPLPGATDSSLFLTNVTVGQAGDYFVVVSNAFGFEISRIATLIVTPPPLFPAKNDFNHDGQTDFLWQHTDGRVNVWLMDGTSRIAVARLRNGRPVPFGSRIAGTHDFDMDGNVDILLQRSDGSLQIWFMNNTNFLRSELISPAPALGTPWQAVGLGDLDRDMHADILFRHNEGYLQVWFMKGKQYVRQTLLFNGQAVPLLWRVAGVADLNNDGYADILWQKPSSAMAVWFMNGPNPVQGPALSHLPKIDAAITGINDLNQDGDPDFIWRHSDGHLSVWWMQQTNRIGSFPVNGGQPVAPAWRLAAPGN